MTSVFVPALQGQFGDWVYYSGLVSLKELRDRVSYAREIHKNEKLSDLIQRRLDDGTRQIEISDFLVKNKDRFFSSLVVGVHGGAPQWHPLSVTVRVASHNIDDKDREAVGYLELDGSERLFALDGQHRLAGVREGLKRKADLESDRVSVIFVSHRNDAAGIQRTRKLFIMLNKHAVPVKKPDIIALDEVDLAAIITRRLVDEHPWFSRDQIDFQRYSNSLPRSDRKYLTTLGNLYEVVNVSVRRIMGTNQEELKDASKIRLPEKRIGFYYDQTIKFFERLGRIDPLLGEYFRSKAPAKLLADARDPASPHLIFRPIGMLITAKVLSDLRRKYSLAESFRRAAHIPLTLNSTPYVSVLWDADRANVIMKGASLAQKLLVHMLNGPTKHERLRRAYAEWRNEPVARVRLPHQLVV